MYKWLLRLNLSAKWIVKVLLAVNNWIFHHQKRQHTQNWTYTSFWRNEKLQRIWIFLKIDKISSILINMPFDRNIYISQYRKITKQHENEFIMALKP